jgi:hypothetical protein
LLVHVLSEALCHGFTTFVANAGGGNPTRV